MSQDIVLAVDDDPDSLDMLTSALCGANYRVLAARDGGAALAQLDHVTPDLILLDAVMPVLDGFETCRRIKARTDAGHIPIVFMTGLTETQHVVAGLKAGGVDYVTKPVVLDELLARIAIHLSNARAAHGARSALDAAGRRLIATDAGGKILWSTPKASSLLGEWTRLLAGLEGLSAAAIRLIAASSDAPAQGGEAATQKIVAGLRELEMVLLGQTPAREFLFRVAETTPGMEKAALQEMLGLTLREADVLFWVSRGKTNRDVSEILNISARTVNKHLEQIFVKLGVENRSAAAAIATRIAAAQA